LLPHSETLKAELTIRAQIHRLQLQSVIAVWLLVTYAVGTIGVDAIHYALHDHSTVVVHTPQQEADSCHRALFHHDTENGCKHKTHFTDPVKCKYSHVVFQSGQILPVQTALTIFTEHHRISSTLLLSPSEGNLFNTFLRGPPVS
jgi:hypothetical protein